LKTLTFFLSFVVFVKAFPSKFPLLPSRVHWSMQSGVEEEYKK